MSFNLTLFNKKAAPKEHKAFLEWLHEIKEREEELDYNDPENLVPELKAAFMEIIKTFPPMNGPLAPTDDEIDENEELENLMIDFDLAQDLIYASIAWSQAEKAAQLFFNVAQKYNVGLFDPQEEKIIE